MSGCTLQTETPMRLGQIIDLKLHISKLDEPIMISSAIVRNTTTNRAGMEFLSLSQPERTRLQFFIRQERGHDDLNGSRTKERSTVAA